MHEIGFFYNTGLVEACWYRMVAGFYVFSGAG